MQVRLNGLASALLWRGGTVGNPRSPGRDRYAAAGPPAAKPLDGCQSPSSWGHRVHAPLILVQKRGKLESWSKRRVERQHRTEEEWIVNRAE